MLNVNDLLNTREAAVLVGVSEALLMRLRRSGGGPKFLRVGTGVRPRVRYRRQDLEAWFNGRIRECSTTGDGLRAA